MARLFVFGIGGTGARVMKSLTMLLASGMKPGNFEVVPILIDPHKDLKELNDTKSLLRLYSEIHQKIYDRAVENDNGFFRSKITTLKSLSPDSGLKDDFEFDERHDVSFRNFLELSNLNPDNPTHDLLSLLYSDKNLNDSLSKGFKGNPNVGSVVLNSIRDSDGFRAFESAFGNDDRIFIISSIFGGTGAAGFPLLLKNFRNHDKTILRDCQIGGLTVMPYFKLSESNESDIDSNSFLTKTKSALTYYIRSEFADQYNAIYYIADPDKQNRPYENNEEEQNNKAHLIEMLGALSVFNFANANFVDKGNVYEYCLESDNINSVDFTNIGKSTSKILGKELTNLYLMSKLNESNIKNDKLPYNKDKFNKEYENEKIFFDDLNKFFNNYFVKWLKELSENERQFNPINLSSNDNFHGLNKGFEFEKSSFDSVRGKSYNISQVHLQMSKELKSKKLKKLKEQSLYQYIVACYNSINTVNSRIKY
jgi:hypothetical protein